MSEKSIIQKIKALLAKTVEAGATEAEAMAAAQKAHELLTKHQISLSELDIKEEGTEQTHMAIDQAKYARYLSVRVAKYCDCKVWAYNEQITFLGLASDAQFAEWLLSALVSFVQRKSVDWSMEQTHVTQQQIEDFGSGMIYEINQKLKAATTVRRAEDVMDQNALVVVKNAMVNEAFAKLGLHLGQGRRIEYRTGSSIFQQGRDAGADATFNRPIHTQTQRAIKAM